MEKFSVFENIMFASDRRGNMFEANIDALQFQERPYSGMTWWGGQRNFILLLIEKQNLKG